MNFLYTIVKTLGKGVLFPFVWMDWRTYKRLDAAPRFPLKIGDVYPCVTDKTPGTKFDRHYIYHTAWAARKLAQIKPVVHTDIASSLYFIGVASAFVPIHFYDFRPPELTLSNVQVGQADLLHLPFADGELKSLSCLHVIEHIGLGRYGDSIDPEGDRKAARELARVLAPGGSLLIVTPVGSPKLRFNAHRVYSKQMVLDLFPDLTLHECTLIPDAGGAPVENATDSDIAAESFGCGCFWFIKE